MPWQVKDLLPHLWGRSQLRLGFDPWPGNVRVPRVWPKEKKRERESLSVFFPRVSETFLGSERLGSGEGELALVLKSLG